MPIAMASRFCALKPGMSCEFPVLRNCNAQTLLLAVNGLSLGFRSRRDY